MVNVGEKVAVKAGVFVEVGGTQDKFAVTLSKVAEARCASSPPLTAKPAEGFITMGMVAEPTRLQVEPLVDWYPLKVFPVL